MITKAIDGKLYFFSFACISLSRPYPCSPASRSLCQIKSQYTAFVSSRITPTCLCCSAWHAKTGERLREEPCLQPARTQPQRSPDRPTAVRPSPRCPVRGASTARGTCAQLPMHRDKKKKTSFHAVKLCLDASVEYAPPLAGSTPTA